MKSQISTSNSKADEDQKDGRNWSQFATSSSRHRGSAYRPWAFTEYGAQVAANILRSERAVQMSVFVIRTFERTHWIHLGRQMIALSPAVRSA